MKRILLIFAALTLAFSIGLYVKVLATRAVWSGPSGGSGIIEGTEVDVVARLGARIVSIRADEGDLVTKGDPVVTLDCREQQAVLRAAQARRDAADRQAQAARAQVRAALGTAAAASARIGATGAQKTALETTRGVAARQLSRLKQLKGEGGATEMEIDRIGGEREQLEAQIRAFDAQLRAAKGQASAAKGQAEAARAQAEAALISVTAAEAEIARAKTLAEECVLTSPIAGYVLTRAFEPGEVVLPGSRILTIVSIDPVETSFFIPNAELAAAQVGGEVSIVADAYPDRHFAGRITAVAKEAEFTPRNVQTRQDRDRLVYRVDIRAANPQGELRPGMPVQIEIPGSEPDRAPRTGDGASL